MKTVIDRQRLRRRATASHSASLGGLAVLLGAVMLSMFQLRSGLRWQPC